MAQLDNPRHEAFCQAIAGGMKGAVAYRKVYGEGIKSAKQNASALLTQPDLSLRVAELRSVTTSGTVKTLQQTKEWLSKIIDAAPGEVDESSPLVQGFKNTAEVREIKLVSKIEAAKLLMLLCGHTDPRLKVTVEGSIEHRHVLTEDRRKELMERRKLALFGGS